MEQSGATSSEAGVAEVELRCPMCEYDVRGLPEARCPECGCEFTWEELTDPGRRRQGWLFEHRRGLGGYKSTQVRLLAPWKFWMTLRPAHRLGVWRIVLFYVLGWVGMLSVWGAVVFPVAVMKSWERALTPPGVLVAPQRPQPRLNQIVRTPNGPMTWQEFARANKIPLPPTRAAVVMLSRTSPEYWQNLWRLVWTDISRKQGYVAWGTIRLRWLPAPGSTSVVEVALAVAAAMWVVMLVMRQSFARAKIKRGHTIRVALYSSDVAGLALLLAAGCGMRFLLSPGVSAGQLDSTMLLLAGVYAVWSIVRFDFALREYLKTPRPAVVAGTTALIAVLMWMAMAVIQ